MHAWLLSVPNGRFDASYYPTPDGPATSSSLAESLSNTTSRMDGARKAVAGLKVHPMGMVPRVGAPNHWELHACGFDQSGFSLFDQSSFSLLNQSGVSLLKQNRFEVACARVQIHRCVGRGCHCCVAGAPTHGP